MWCPRTAVLGILGPTVTFMGSDTNPPPHTRPQFHPQIHTVANPTVLAQFLDSCPTEFEHEVQSSGKKTRIRESGVECNEEDSPSSLSPKRWQKGKQSMVVLTPLRSAKWLAFSRSLGRSQYPGSCNRGIIGPERGKHSNPPKRSNHKHAPNRYPCASSSDATDSPSCAARFK